MVKFLDNAVPDWDAPLSVSAFTTRRTGGVSRPPFESLNLGTHVGDNQAVVAENRMILWQDIQRKSPSVTDISWLTQVHGARVTEPCSGMSEADALFTNRKGRVLAIMTADCLPVFFSTRDGSEIALAHAGWRGLVDGVLQATVARFSSTPDTILAHLGPAIGPTAFEVGDDVRTAFISRDNRHGSAFKPAPTREGPRYYCDLYALAIHVLSDLGITAISGGRACTWSQTEQYFSYRRDGQTGRMASVIWLD